VLFRLRRMILERCNWWSRLSRVWACPSCKGRIESILTCIIGNCPKYLNKKQIIPRVPQPKLESTSFPLPESAIDLIRKADLFFISSSNHTSDMDTNHRGGPKGFVRILENNEDGFTLVSPEYSGNRLYQTLGNLKTTPRAGLVFPDFETGDVLYLTGTTEILAGKDAAELIGRTNLAVRIQVKHYRYVKSGLAFRAEEGEFSPYNPAVRYLNSEDKLKVGQASSVTRATLVKKEILTPTIGRFRFKLDDGQSRHSWKPGQWVALDFSDELDLGYSHMREDDPKSLNDDWIRTFTVSSRLGVPDDDGHFEITIRKVGPVTNHLFNVNPRTQLEIGVKGFGGDFYFKQAEGESISFVAAGVGITPLLAQIADLDIDRLKLYWTVRFEHLRLVFDTLQRHSGLKSFLRLYVTGKIDEASSDWQKASTLSSKVEKRRFAKEDFEDDLAARCYICTGTPLRNALVDWLGGKVVVYENFDY
jgi:ferredoxin-NADP reductase